MRKVYINRRKRAMTCYIIGNENGDRTRKIEKGEKFYIDESEPLGPQHNHSSRVIGYFIPTCAQQNPNGQWSTPQKATFSKWAIANYCDLQQ